MRHLTSVFVFLVAILSHGQSVSDSLANELTSAFKETSLKGIGLVLVDEEGVYYKQSLGYADVAEERPYTTGTFQPIASISKTLLGVSLMKAQELGLLSLDDDVNQYLPFRLANPHHPEATITIRHLASHTASIYDTKHYEKAYILNETIEPGQLKGFKKEAKRFNSNVRMPLDEFLQRIYAKNGAWFNTGNFLKSAPGSTYQYSNNGAALASMIVSKASGMSYQAFVKKYILDPMGMEASCWRLTEIPEDRRAVLYAADSPLPAYELITFADGGFVTSPDEFALYFSAIIRGFQNHDQPLLNKSSFDEMLSPQIDNEEKPGIFWVAGDKRIGHTGGDPGVITVAYFTRDKPVGIILFTNTSDTKTAGKDVGKLFRIADKYAQKVQTELR